MPIGNVVAGCLVVGFSVSIVESTSFVPGLSVGIVDWFLRIIDLFFMTRIDCLRCLRLFSVCSFVLRCLRCSWIVAFSVGFGVYGFLVVGLQAGNIVAAFSVGWVGGGNDPVILHQKF